MILGINTAENTHEMVLFDDSENPRILSQKKWQNSREDVDNLVPYLEGMLNNLELSKQDIKKIVATIGPGSFTSLRTGVAFANALKKGLDTELYGIGTFELLRRKVATKDPLLVLLHAGGMDSALMIYDTDAKTPDQIQIGALSNLLAKIKHNHSMKIVYELPETLQDELTSICKEKRWEIIPTEKLQTFGETLVLFGTKGLKTYDILEPVYLKEANITLSSDPWKKP